eukprot:463706-Rhodomonas_salina.1
MVFICLHGCNAVSGTRVLYTAIARRCPVLKWRMGYRAPMPCPVPTYTMLLSANAWQVLTQRMGYLVLSTAYSPARGCPVLP